MKTDAPDDLTGPKPKKIYRDPFTPTHKRKTWDLYCDPISIKQFLAKLRIVIATDEIKFELIETIRYKFTHFQFDPELGVRPIYKPVQCFRIERPRVMKLPDDPISVVFEHGRENRCSCIWVACQGIGLTRDKASQVVRACIDSPLGYSKRLRKDLLAACFDS
jgi:hypothetical protein